MNSSWYENFARPACKIILSIIFVFSTLNINGQRSKIDSLKNLITNTKRDTAKINLYEKLGQAYRDEKKMDSCIWSYQWALEINERNNYSQQRQCWNIGTIDYVLYEMGNYSESLKFASQGLVLSEKLNDTAQKGFSHLVFGHDYRELGEYRQALNHYFKAKKYFKVYWISKNKPEDNTFTILCIAQTYLKMNILDSALWYTRIGYKLGVASSDGGYILLSTRILGDIYFAKNNDEAALHYYRRYIPDFVKYKEKNRDLGFALNNMSKIFQKRGQIDSAILYAKQAFANAQEYQDQENLFTAATLLSNYYERKDDHAAFSYLKIATQAKDSMIGTDKLKQAQILSFSEQVREKEQQEADAKEAARDRRVIIIAAILVSIISFLIWNRIKQLRLRHKMILEQKESEKLKTKYEKNLIELEAKALRTQMNPHFVFNCLNSIKSLIQQNENEKSVTYLTTFSKLIRTLFNNADKKEINLYDEIETCKLYTQLESLRFGDKFNYRFNIGDTIDLKSVQIPALIIQPFIENAIWHGIMPKKDGGTVIVSVDKIDNNICCTIDDDGIGREVSKQNKFKSEPSAHQSKGIHLTQSRLDLDNLLTGRNASLETIDKKDVDGKPSGTSVVLNLKEY